MRVVGKGNEICRTLYHVLNFNKCLVLLGVINQVFRKAKYIEISEALLNARIFLLLIWTK
jgi:hypothetical protein